MFLLNESHLRAKENEKVNELTYAHTYLQNQNVPILFQDQCK